MNNEDKDSISMTNLTDALQYRTTQIVAAMQRRKLLIQIMSGEEPAPDIILRGSALADNLRPVEIVVSTSNISKQLLDELLINTVQSEEDSIFDMWNKLAITVQAAKNMINSIVQQRAVKPQQEADLLEELYNSASNK